MSPHTLINGLEEDAITVQDRALHYGDGLFETFAVIHSEPQYWERHYRRLACGCKRLKLPLPEEGLLRMEASQICRGVERGVLKFILTRGRGNRGYRFPDPMIPTRLFSLYPWPGYPKNYLHHGIRVRICTMRLARNPMLAGIKHLNRLEQVLARNEWDDPAIAEGLMLDTEGYVVEGTMTNLFLVWEDTLISPDLSYCGICGIMRECILEAAARLTIPTLIQPVYLGDLYKAEEAFVCNSIIGIWPIRQIQVEPMHILSQTRLTSRLVEYVKRAGKVCETPCLNS